MLTVAAALVTLMWGVTMLAIREVYREGYKEGLAAAVREMLAEIRDEEHAPSA